MRDKKTKILLSVLAFSSMLLILVSVSYAYVSRRRIVDMSKNTTDLSAATTGQLKLIYSDCTEESSSDCRSIRKNLNPGQSVTKTFQIKNDSAYDLKYTI
ncbi:MAG TPA: hypothetical protein DCY94_01465, partial [Firmicutes bacterium]|nr:hypothetical protein [Bacillota bacterium]